MKPEGYRTMTANTQSTTISAALTVMLASAVVLHASAALSVVGNRHDFDTRSLLVTRDHEQGTAFTLDDPSRFSMRQSYSVSAMSSRAGSASSGVYLNTVTYQVTEPLSLSLDMGVHTPFHSSIPGIDPHHGAGGTSLIIPRMGLEYRPNDRMSVHVDLVNGPDAWKAYGISPRGPHFAPWGRFQH